MKCVSTYTAVCFFLECGTRGEDTVICIALYNYARYCSFLHEKDVNDFTVLITRAWLY